MEEEKKELRKKSGMSVAALTLGIISLITNLFWYIALPTGVLAIIFGAITTKKIGSKMGKAGLITGIIGIVLTTFIFLTLTVILLLASVY